MTATAKHPPRTMIDIINSNGYITEEHALLDAYLSGHLSLQQFWPDDGLYRFHIDPLSTVLDKVLWSQLTTGQCDKVWWQRVKLLVDHATMWEVDKLEEAEVGIEEYKKDFQGFRDNLRRTGGCLIWDQLSQIACYSSWAVMEKKLENGAVLAFGTTFFKAFYPIAQFNERGRVIKGVREVHAELEGDIVESFNFLVEKNLRLEGRAPIELLREGNKRRVLQLARARAEELLDTISEYRAPVF